jgi:hypothetical protein
MEQGFLFETRRDVLKGESEYLAPIDPNVAPLDEVRLTGQNAAILERLRRGPATNAELCGLSLKYTSRISDLRAAGYDIDCQRGSGGLNTYTLKEGRRCQTTSNSSVMPPTGSAASAAGS